jgi:O-antigen/teichoic acid export membrane protein
MTLGINAAMPRLYVHADANAKSAGWVALLLIQIGFTFLLLILGAGIHFAVPNAWGEELAKFVMPTLLFAVVSSVQMTYQGLAIARGASSRLMVATLLQLISGLTLAQLLSERFGGVGYVYALLVSSGAATAVLAAFRHPRPEWHRLSIRGGLRLAVPFIGQGLSTWLVALFDRIAIGLLLGASQVGGYQVAYMAGSVLGMILEGLQAAWAPRYYKSSANEKHERLKDLLTPSLWIATGMALLVSAAAPLVVPVLAPGYEVNFVLVSLVALSALPRSAYFVAVAQLLNDGRSMAVVAATLTSAIFTVPSSFLLIPILGVLGGGVVTLAAFSIQAVLVCRQAFGWTTLHSARHVVLPVIAVTPVALSLLFSAQLTQTTNVLLAIFLAVIAGFIVLKSLRMFSAVLARLAS